MTGTSDSGSRVESLMIATVHQHRLEQRIAEIEKALALAQEALTEAEEYFDDRADADCGQDGYIPNEEMKHLCSIRNALVVMKGAQ